MNLIWHLNHSNETVPLDIAKRIVSHGIAPVITVSSTLTLDDNIKKSYGMDSMYYLLRFFGGCVSDRDQANELLSEGNDLESKPSEHHANDNFLQIPNPNNSTTTRRRSNSNSLVQRDQTQLQYIRFSKPLPDLLSSIEQQKGIPGEPEKNKITYDNQSLEKCLSQYLNLINTNTSWNTNHTLLRKSIYHNFFSQTLSSTENLSPFESFNHPIVSLIALDISQGQTYEDARDLLITFKNLNKFIDNFPPYLNLNDILPVFLLCYDKNSPEQETICNELVKKIKKQLFVESVVLPLWNSGAHSEKSSYKILHEPIMTSLDETLTSISQPKAISGDFKLPSTIIDEIYDMLDILVHKLLIPYMERKISYWDETIMQPRKSLFHGNRFFKKFINKTNQTQIQSYKTADGTEQFLASSDEFLLRKLADWSIMISNFKIAFTTYDSLANDLENFPLYLASCLEWCSVSLLMGAQSIVTVKMIKNDITPLIDRAVEIYKFENRPNFETRCMLLFAELFLSLSDSWTSTPYAINYLETILSDGKLKPLSQTLIWERLSDCYSSRIDPRINVIYKIDQNSRERSPSPLPMGHDTTLDTNSMKRNTPDILSKGLTRRRKAAFFRLIAAKKWSEQGNWRQVNWCLKDIHDIYDNIGLFDRQGLILNDLNLKLQEQMTTNA